MQGWLRHLNARDYDIYLCVNPVRPGSGGREKGDIAEIRRLQLDLDEEGATGLGRVLEDVNRGERAAAGPCAAEFERSLPDPVGYGSGGVGDGRGGGSDEGTGSALRRGPSGDGRGASDENAGVQKQEAGQGRGARHLGLARGAAGEAGGFPRAWLCPSRSRPGEAGGGRRMPLGHYSQSERDWAAAGDALRSGEAPETVISRLEHQRQDKPNPGYYARRTVRRKEEELKRGLPRPSRKESLTVGF